MDNRSGLAEAAGNYREVTSDVPHSACKLHALKTETIITENQTSKLLFVASTKESKLLFIIINYWI